MKRFSEYADADVRYNVSGYVVRSEDLFHLDQFIFAARRITVPLNSYPHDEVSKNWIELLKESPGYQPRGQEFKRLLEDIPDFTVHDAALCWNFALSQVDHSHGAFNRFSSARSNPTLHAVILNTPEDSPDTLVADLADWAVGNIKLPPNLERDLRQKANRLRKG